jgi:hypothetical protein
VSIAGRRRFATVALIVVLVELVIEVGWDLVGIVLMGGLFTVSGDWAAFHDTLMVIERVIYVLAYLVCGVAFIRWQRQMSRGLLLLDGAPLNPGVGLSSWGWFIPFVNMVIPYLSLRQIARRTAPPGQAPSVGLVRWWWFCWLTARFCAYPVGIFYMLADEPKPWITATTVDVLVNMLLILAGVLTLQMIRRYSEQLEDGLTRREAAARMNTGSELWESAGPS